MVNSLLIESGQIFTYVIFGVLIVAIIVMFVLSSKRRKKQEQEAQDLINAVKPGNKVKTIGGICGIVVEVDNEENTFVLETGTENSGKCYIKFDRQAIYQTDAVVDKKEEKAVEKTADEAENLNTDNPAPAQVPDLPELPEVPSLPEVPETSSATVETEEKTTEELRNPPAKKGGKKKN